MFTTWTLCILPNMQEPPHHHQHPKHPIGAPKVLHRSPLTCSPDCFFLRHPTFFSSPSLKASGGQSDGVLQLCYFVSSVVVRVFMSVLVPTVDRML